MYLSWLWQLHLYCLAPNIHIPSKMQSLSTTEYLAIPCCYSSIGNKAAFGVYPAVLIKAKLLLKSRGVWLDKELLA